MDPLLFVQALSPVERLLEHVVEVFDVGILEFHGRNLPYLIAGLIRRGQAPLLREMSAFGIWLAVSIIIITRRHLPRKKKQRPDAGFL
jgi:hypothetical protein